MSYAKLSVGLAVFALVGVLASTQLSAQEKKGEGPKGNVAAPKPADPKAQPGNKPGEGQPPFPGMTEEMMKNMQQYCTPGPEHARLQKAAGKWTAQIKMWDCTAPAGTPPTDCVGEMTCEPRFDGRYMVSQFKGDMGGMPFEGFAIDGYDRMNKQYVSFWIDNMGTGFYTTTGQADASGNTITYQGKWDDVMSGEKDMPVRLVSRWVDDNTMQFEMYSTQKGQERKGMEITYRRAGK